MASEAIEIGQGHVSPDSRGNSFDFSTTPNSHASPCMVYSNARQAMQNNPSSAIPEPEIPRPAAADWLWRPWYAKLWWATIPIYWAVAAASLKIPALRPFFESAFAGYLYVLFFPLTPLLVLGFGFARAWLERPLVGDPLSDEEIEELLQMRMEDEWRERPGPHWSVDIYDPRSGGLYIGNPNRLQHPGRRY